MYIPMFEYFSLNPIAFLSPFVIYIGGIGGYIFGGTVFFE
jgi:hypothetical protein